MLKLVSRVDSEYELHLILNDHDYQGRPLFKLIVDLELPTLFYRLEGFIESLWTSEYQLGGNPLDSLTTYKLLFNIHISSTTDVEE